MKSPSHISPLLARATENPQDEDPETSLSGLVSTLVPSLLIALAYFVIFLVLRTKQRRFYAPRTYLGSLRENERTPALPTGFLNWIGPFRKIPDVYALQHQSLDAYLFLRFLRISMGICLLGICLTWPVLLPLDATGGNGKTQLSLLTWGNIRTSDRRQKRKLYGHAIVAFLYYGIVLYTIMREIIFYINLRQAYLLSPGQATRMSNRTVLFAAVPVALRSEAGMRSVFGDDKVKRVWLTGGNKFVDEVVEDRNKTALKLEGAEIKLIKTAIVARSKAGHNSKEDAETGNIASRWVPDSKRPKHKTGFLGLFGPKVDTITWCRERLARLIPDSMAAQERYGRGDHRSGPAVFVEFHTQEQAQAAFQMLIHQNALHMAPRYIGVRPNQVVWSALNVTWWQRVVFRYIALAFLTAMIVFWAVPVAFASSLTNIADLQKKYQWLSFLDKFPEVIFGLITGLLPAVVTTVLLMLVPIIMRLCARLSGEPTLARVELFTQNAFFFFQLVNVFFVATIASSVTAVIGSNISDTTKVPQLLAEKLPKAYSYYVTYFLFQGLTIGVGALVQIVGLIIFKVLYTFLATTPRSMYQNWSTLTEVGWGTTMPTMALLTLICLVYATIAPIVSGFALLGLFLFYIAYRYNVLYVTDTITDTMGLLYPRALKHLLVGVYIAELCMVGLLSISQAYGPLVILVILLIVTIFFNISMFKALNPLLYSLPQTLYSQQTHTPYNTENKSSGPGVVQSSTTDNALKKGNFFMRWLKPWVYCDYASLSHLIPKSQPLDVDAVYHGPDARFAYNPPSVGSKVPLLWIPQDPAGISKQEVLETGKVIPITDEQSTIDDKGKIHWNPDGGRPPVWEEKIEY